MHRIFFMHNRIERFLTVTLKVWEVPTVVKVVF